MIYHLIVTPQEDSYMIKNKLKMEWNCCVCWIWVVDVIWRGRCRMYFLQLIEEQNRSLIIILWVVFSLGFQGIDEVKTSLERDSFVC